MRASLRKLLWILVVVFAFHEAEEWNLVAWFRIHFTPEPGFTAQGARTLLALFAALAAMHTALSLRFFSERAAVFALAPLVLAIVLGNAWTHVYWALLFRGYVPGLITGLALIPLALAFARIVLRERIVPSAYVFVWIGLSALQPLAAVLSGTRLSESQLEFQELGERLARWLWGSV